MTDQRSSMKIVVIGGSGLIGSKVVTMLGEHGHQAVPASPNSGVNTLTGEGLAEVLAGASVVVDVSTLTADRSQFIEKTLHQIAGSMAIYLVNKDEGVHTFDIEVAGRHYSYPVAARSTTGVLLDIPSAGKYAFWCDIPGHRQSGMQGVLEVSKN